MAGQLRQGESLDIPGSLAEAASILIPGRQGRDRAGNPGAQPEKGFSL